LLGDTDIFDTRIVNQNCECSGLMERQRYKNVFTARREGLELQEPILFEELGIPYLAREVLRCTVQVPPGSPEFL